MAVKSKTRLKFRKQTAEKEYNFETTKPAFYDYYPAYSFKYYEHNHRDYSAVHITQSSDFHEMFEKLNIMAQKKWKEMINSPKYFHFHRIKWESTAEPNGFKNLNHKELPPAWQFKSFKECRMIGFFNSRNIFEVVWIDREHKVYPNK